MTKETETVKEEKKYTRAQLLKSENYRGYADLVNALMGPEERLTPKELDKRITKFLSKKCN